MLGVVHRIVRDRDVAQEVLQEAFLLIWQRASSYDRHLGSGRGWLYTVVRHRALDEVRRHRPEVSVGDGLDALAEQAHGMQQAPSTDAEALQRCLNTLDERNRSCIVSAFVEGYTHEQISRRLGLPIGTVKSWIRRGLLSLRECLS